MPASRNTGDRPTTGRATRNSGSSAKTTTATLRVVGEPPDGYEVPVLHVQLPERAVNVAFWGLLLGSVAIGAVDVPLAALVGLGVLIARHRNEASGVGEPTHA